MVTIDLADAGDSRTRLTFTHAGWGTGAEWDKAYDYFDRVWGGFVLPMLKHRIEHGPVDWSDMPKVAPVAQSLKVMLVPGRRGGDGGNGNGGGGGHGGHGPSLKHGGTEERRPQTSVFSRLLNHTAANARPAPAASA